MTNPIQLELLRNLFEAAAEEMGITLQRVAFSANIKERRDFSCALFSPAGDLLAQAAHIPVHLGSMPASVAAVLRALPDLADGDVAILNDPFQGGTHLPDITVVSPIVHDAQVVGYAANRAHHADVGGATPGSMTLSTHIDQEGIRIEPALIRRAGEWNRDVLDRLLAAVRTPDERLGDLEAQLAANHVGAVALSRMITRHGLATVQNYGRALLDYSQAFMSRAIASIPRGEYRYEDVMDDDGASSAPVPIRATLRAFGDRVQVDLRDSADQVAGCINCPEAVTRSAVYYCFACLLDEGVPLNGGAFRDIEVLTRPNSLLDARYPAAVVAGNTETSQRVVDVVFGALAQAIPERIPAASCGTMSSVALGSRQAGAERSGAPDSNAWTYYETIGGGTGAGPTSPGASAVQCHMTNTLNTPAEALEMQYPLRVRAFHVHANGGAGRHPGGHGIRRVLEALAPCEGTILSDRRSSRPYGLQGGHHAQAGANILHTRTAAQPTMLAGKCQFKLADGDRLEINTPGGGGWGAPRA